VGVRHDWDEEDYRSTLEQAFTEYYSACYPEGTIEQQRVEVRQAFLSGIVWLCHRDNYDPDELIASISAMLFKQ
jgi:hypothetical protein